MPETRPSTRVTFAVLAAAAAAFSVLQSLVNPVLPTIQHELHTTQGAVTSVYVASAPELEDVTGRYFANGRPRASSARSHDTGVAARLWRAG